jgi:hypothetical protein
MNRRELIQSSITVASGALFARDFANASTDSIAQIPGAIRAADAARNRADV